MGAIEWLRNLFDKEEKLYLDTTCINLAKEVYFRELAINTSINKYGGTQKVAVKTKEEPKNDDLMQKLLKIYTN